MKKAIIYARVSTNNQDTKRQVTDLTQWATANNFKVVRTFLDTESGKVSASKRLASNGMFHYIKSNKVDIVLVSEISRIGRSAIDVQKNISTIVDTLDTDLYIKQQGLRAKTTKGKTNTAFKLITDVLANVAQMEREQISERVKSGLRQAVKNGKKLGRRKGSFQTDTKLLKKYKRVVKALDIGLSLRKVAKLCDVSLSTVQKVKATLIKQCESRNVNRSKMAKKETEKRLQYLILENRVNEAKKVIEGLSEMLLNAQTNKVLNDKAQIFDEVKELKNMLLDTKINEAELKCLLAERKVQIAQMQHDRIVV